MSVVKDVTISVILRYHSGMFLHTTPQVEVLVLITWGARKTWCFFSTMSSPLWWQCVIQLFLQINLLAPKFYI